MRLYATVAPATMAVLNLVPTHGHLAEGEFRPGKPMPFRSEVGGGTYVGGAQVLERAGVNYMMVRAAS